jgi:hypothetical protein
MNFVNHRCATPEKKEMGKCLNKRINEERKTEPYDKAFTFVFFCVCAGTWLYTKLGWI